MAVARRSRRRGGRLCLTALLFFTAVLTASLSVGAALVADSSRRRAAAALAPSAPSGGAPPPSTCTAFSQARGGSCDWECKAVVVSTALTCQWCDNSTPPLCVGANGNISWAPDIVPAVGDCAVPARAATCSGCQYGATDPSAVLLACAVGASIVAAAAAASQCENCDCAPEESCGDACSATSVSCGVLACGTCALGVLVARGTYCSRGCHACGRECIEPADEGEDGQSLLADGAGGAGGGAGGF